LRLAGGTVYLVVAFNTADGEDARRHRGTSHASCDFVERAGA
jgi:hypothetical protein